MNEQQAGRPAVLRSIASVLNLGGRAIVFSVEKSAEAAYGILSATKSIRRSPAKIVNAVSAKLNLRDNSSNKIEEQIREYERKIKSRYYAIGKESAHSPNCENILQQESIQRFIADINEYEQQVQQLKKQIVESKTRKHKVEIPKYKKVTTTHAPFVADKVGVTQYLRNAIDIATKKGDFLSSSAQAVFHKVAKDLLDTDSEIRILAAAELGKIGNSAAVPVLIAAARHDDAELVAEVLNSLIALGDLRAVELFKEQVVHPQYRVRMSCLRGIYKLGEDEVAGPVLISALHDEHPEVRRSAVTFLGWKEYANVSSALVQCLYDEEPNVRKAAVLAIANLRDENTVLPLIKILNDQVLEIREKALEAIQSITGESIVFNIHATSDALEIAINDYITWWQNKRSENIITPKIPMTATAVEGMATATHVEKSAEEIPTPKVPTAETVTSASVAGLRDKEEINDLSKVDLLALCEKYSISYDTKMTKSELKKRLQNLIDN